MLGVAAIVFVAIGVLGPRDIPGWQYVSQRFLTLGVLLSLALLPTERTRWTASPAARGAGVLLALSWIGASAWLNVRLSRACASAVAATDAPLRLHGMQIPVVNDAFCGLPPDPGRSPVPYLAPLRHVEALYATSLGGSVPILFAGPPSIYAFRPREDDVGRSLPQVPLDLFWAPDMVPGFRDDPAARERALTRIGVYGPSIDAIEMVEGKGGDVEILRHLGFEIAWQNASVTVLTFRGCASELVFEGVAQSIAGPRAPPSEGRVPVAFGVGDIEEPVWAGKLDFARLLPGTSMITPLRFCGRVWVRFDRGTCANEDGEGRVLATVTKEHPTITCGRR
jgi:hypothetical protein